jgi:hypothetical protein
MPTTNWSTIQLSLRPRDEQERLLMQEFAGFWKRTRSLGESLGWNVTPGAIVQLYFQHNPGVSASEVFLSPSKRDRFLFRVTPIPGAREKVLAALQQAAGKVPGGAEVATSKVSRSGGVKVDVVEVRSTWEDVIGEDEPTGAMVEDRLYAFAEPLLRAIPSR